VNRLLFRLSLRDLRRHWVAVIAIALVIAIGTGVFAGLRGTSAWRRESNDRSFEKTAIHELRAELSAGTYVDEGTLLDVVDGLDSADAVTAVTERLVVISQIDASTPEETILVQARLVGMPFDEPGSPTFVDALWLRDGRLPGGSLAEVVLEAKFADFYGLPPRGTATMAGGRTVDYVGLGVGPEDFWVTGPEGSIFAQGDFALVYSTIETAQGLAGQPGQVNDVVFTLEPGTDRRRVENELRDALDAVAGVSATVTDRDDVEAFSVLYDDIENDEQVWTMISILVLLAAALAAFNLVNRIVEAQRREIGIGMALGVPRRRLAIRPLMVGAQIGLIGTIAGVGVGALLGWLMKGLFESLLPLPEWRTPFQYGVYASAAVLGFGIPVLAAAIPVWRAVRVEPIEAIRTGHLTARSSRITDWTNRLRLPGSSLASMPVRNVLRTPRRTLLTAVGVGAAITALVAVLGMLDSFSRSIERGGDEVTKGDPDRVLVTLDTFYGANAPEVLAVGAADAVGRADASLRIGAVAIDPDDPDDDIDLLLELIDMDTAAWTPTIVEGANGDGGLVLAQKAADDLGVGPGDTVNIRHLVMGGGGPSMGISEIRVDGIHPNPIRNFAFGDLALAERFGLDGFVNLVNAYPSDEATRGDVQAAVFGLDGVTSAQAVARFAEIFDEAIEQFAPILFVTAGFVLALAILIAFNSSRITVEERRREHATMRAFGLPVRSVMAVVVKESVLVGVFATAIGLVTGTLILGWMLTSLAENSLPDLGISVYLAPQTLVIALIVGVVAVAVAPLFLIRSLRRMNVPDTLRVME
jgi:putative ABC transport system permease protein